MEEKMRKYWGTIQLYDVNLNWGRCHINQCANATI